MPPAADLGVDVNLCHKEVTTESSGEYLAPRRHGPGSCLQTLIDFLSETHNSLVREVRRASHMTDRSVLHQQLSSLLKVVSLPLQNEVRTTDGRDGSVYAMLQAFCLTKLKESLHSFKVRSTTSGAQRAGF